ncbi:LacI family DNA-binding transcriptional regulator [Microbacterium invictum]|uniref:LacI family transcriptional regulator n=1 Tax=Microbacterium invictum TaxID=515415 RepID=A0AA40SRY3_9MICO|nr:MULTISPECIES: LacI family DNA-binding transcriptional regulator [Microbacterium]MBB4141161.1 LacI family transcriptional regulator [Microbacterium invictum]
MAVSVRDVAEDAGVSVGTVSNVLNHPAKVSPETVSRVQDSIARLGFVRNDAARQLRAGRSRTIGLVVLDLRNPFFTEVARGAEQRAAERGLSVLVANSDDDPAREDTHLDLFEQQRAFGVLITPVGDDLDRLARMRERGVPSVLVDRESAEGDVASVAVDDDEGGRLAAAHLLEIGRRRLAFVGGPAAIRQVADRLEGARAAVAAQPGATLEVIERPALTVLDGRAAGEAILARQAADRPDAVFAANDLLAVGLLQAFAIMGGARVPEDIALIGYDDIDFAAATVVPLSSIRQPARLIGATAVDLLVEEIESPDTGGSAVRFQPELIVRESTVGR